MKYIKSMVASFFFLPMWACISNTDEPPAEMELSAQLSGTARATITFNNTIDVSSDTVQVAGFLDKTPSSFVPANQGDRYTETGIGNITSFHINYTAGSKKCHFDSAAFPSSGTNPVCTFTKNAQSQGTTFANCTATITNFDFGTCSQSVTFSMQ